MQSCCVCARQTCALFADILSCVRTRVRSYYGWCIGPYTVRTASANWSIPSRPACSLRTAPWLIASAPLCRSMEHVFAHRAVADRQRSPVQEQGREVHALAARMRSRRPRPDVHSCSRQHPVVPTATGAEITGQAATAAVNARMGERRTSPAPTGVGDRDNGPVDAQDAAHTALWPETVRTVRTHSACDLYIQVARQRWCSRHHPFPPHAMQ